MDVEQVIELLAYRKVPGNWVSGAEADPITAHLWRLAQKAGVYGSYTFRTSPPSDNILPSQPAVHIATAADAEEARAIHRSLWNLGTSPFLIVALPHQIRVYAGFNYDANEIQQGILDIIDELTPDNISAGLRDFHADAVDSGRIWQTQAKNLRADRRVDRRLLKNLEKLGEELIDKRGVDPQVAHALIGKYIYISYLEHRRILSEQWLENHGIALEEVTGRNATLSDLKKLSEALERRFNGGIFPIPFEGSLAPSDDVVQFVAGVFRGDDPVSGQLALDFRSYDFSYIPIEMLSSIYEQFLRTEGKDKGDGAYYTREFIADYLISELHSVKPLEREMKILDPACGSGVFLVLAYRRLIESELRRQNKKKLLPDELRELLVTNVFGVERSLDACYVSEFSLILTLLSYLDPPELHENEDFRFPILHNRNIFNCDFFANESEFWKRNIKFDWVVGNPPWIKLKKKNGSRTQPHAWEWMHDKENILDRPVGKYSVCEAFSWRAVEVLKDTGYIGLLIHATSLFNTYSKEYRKKFFTEHNIHRITNFSNLAYVLFAGRSDAPAATIIYTKMEAGRAKGLITHCGPFLANQMILRAFDNEVPKGQTWVLTLYEDEIKTINALETETGEAAVWKVALWGTHRDAQTIRRFNRLFPIPLAQLIKERNWEFHQGLEICHKETPGCSYVEELKDYQRLDVDSMSGGFYLDVPSAALSPIPADLHYVKPQAGRIGLKVAAAPHIYWTVTFAAYSDLDFVLPKPQIGIAAPKEDALYLQALSIYMNSSIARFLLFFMCASWGIDRNKFAPTEAENLPTPDFTPAQIRELASVQSTLSRDLQAPGQMSFFGDIPTRNTENAVEAALRFRIDDEVERILRVPQDLGIVARDFMLYRYRFIKGNLNNDATRSASSDDLLVYAKYLQEELDGFAETHHKVELYKYSYTTVCVVEVTRSSQPFEPIIQEYHSRPPEAIRQLWSSAGLQFSQWAYFQRGLRVFSGSKVYVFKTSRIVDWTKTQAMLDADDIIAEVLSTR